MAAINIDVQKLNTYSDIRKAFGVIKAAATEAERELSKRHREATDLDAKLTLNHASLEIGYVISDCIGYREEIKGDEPMANEVDLEWWRNAVQSEIDLYNKFKTA
jgi:hypothetical protein